MKDAMDVLGEWFAAGPRADSVDWARVESELGTALPVDYKRFYDRFPPCTVGSLFIAHPTIGEATSTMGERTRLVPDLLQMIEDEIGTDERWPDASDLLPWGDIDLIPMFCWDRSSSVDPNHWQTVVFDTDHVRIQRVDRTMSECVQDLVLGTLDFDFIDAAALRRRPLTMYVWHVGPVEAAFHDRAS